MAAGAPVDVAAEESPRGEAGQAEAFPAEVCLVGVPSINRQSRHAVRTTPTRRRGAGLRQCEKTLEPQRPLQDLGAHPDRAQASAAQLTRRATKRSAARSTSPTGRCVPDSWFCAARSRTWFAR